MVERTSPISYLAYLCQLIVFKGYDRRGQLPPIIFMPLKLTAVLTCLLHGRIVR